MKILLTVSKAPSGNPLLGQIITLNDGDSIGRGADNQLILIDEERVVSSRHAQFKQKDDEFLLIDQSTNGTYYNDSAEAIGKNNSQALSNGDLINIGDYQFSLELVPPTALPEGLEHAGFLDQVAAPAADQQTPAHIPKPEASDAPAADGDFDQWLTPVAGVKPLTQAWGSAAPDSLSGTNPLINDGNEVSNDPLAALGQSAPSWSGSAAAGDSPLDDGNDDTDSKWWQTELDNAPANQQAMPEIKIASPTPAPAPVPQAAPKVPAAAPAPASSTVAAELAQLLGLRNLSPQQEASLAPISAAIIQQTTEHLLSLLQSRASIKNELRTSRTMIQTSENNPLKFSASTADALQALFANASDSFLPPEQAIKESFEDIADHQVAMLFAMKQAFNEMLANFQPSKLEAKFNTAGRGLLAGLKSKNWESYGALYQQLQSDPETSYNQLFGEAFAQAYETKLLDLKASRRFTTL